MNFLAHIFLSGKNEELLIGNFIADSVKGRKYLEYPVGIQKGILLHRAIDFYTDTHPVVRKSTSRLFSNYSHYSGVIVDIYYDHFLARDWKLYSDVPLEGFIVDFYQLLQDNYELLPSRVQSFMPHMLKENWLLSYATLEGIGRILYQMNQRTNFVSGMDLAVKDLQEHYEQFHHEFHSFFPDLEVFCSKKIKSLDLGKKI